jgi:RNA polymerase sigma factor (sigma-70 family)
VTSTLSSEGTAPVVTAEDDEARVFEAELIPLLGDAVRLATGMLLSAADAEDALQEACLRAWRRRANRRPDTDLRPWFLAILANQCRELRQSRWSRVLRLADIPASAEVLSADLGPGLDLRQAVSRLSYRRRLAVVLRYYLDLPYESIASVSGCSVYAAKALVRRGTSDLEKALRASESMR